MGCIILGVRPRFLLAVELASPGPTQDAEAELRRKEEEVQAVRDSLARELEQKRARLRTMDEEVMRKRCETDAAAVGGSFPPQTFLPAHFCTRRKLAKCKSNQSLERRDLWLRA